MFNSNHKFKTSNEDRKGNLKRFLCAFLAFALVFGTISIVVILKHNDVSLRDFFSGNETTAVESSDLTTVHEEAIPKEISGKANFLIYCSDPDIKELYFLSIVTADMDEQIFKVYPLNPDNKDYVTALQTGGYRSLIDKIESAENVKIDKYIASDSNTFSVAINYMGGLKFMVDNRIEHRADDYTLILTEGKQTIIGETLIKYFRYCKENGDLGMAMQGKLICAMLDGFINEKNLDKGTTLYRKLLTKIESKSDISYVELAQALPTLKAFCTSEERQSSITILNKNSID